MIESLWRGVCGCGDVKERCAVRARTNARAHTHIHAHTEPGRSRKHHLLSNTVPIARKDTRKAGIDLVVERRLLMCRQVLHLKLCYLCRNGRWRRENLRPGHACRHVPARWRTDIRKCHFLVLMQTRYQAVVTRLHLTGRRRRRRLRRRGACPARTAPEPQSS